MPFDPSRSELSRDPEKLGSLVRQLEARLGHRARIVGILEIGSFTKDEAVPSSDTDLRIYAESSEAYLWQSFGTDQKAKLRPEKEQKFLDFLEGLPHKPRQVYEWEEFNNPVSHELSQKIDINFEFGVADLRFVRHEFSELGVTSCGEYELLFQGAILFDPEGELSRLHMEHFGVRYPSLKTFYQQRYLDQLQPQVVLHTEPNEFDQHKVEKSGQIPWVKWAVRALRDAVASKTYQTNGKFTYRKHEVLDFYKQYLPQHLGLVELLYGWKTDWAIRSKMIQDFMAGPAPFFDEFASLTPKLEQVVSDVKRLVL